MPFPCYKWMDVLLERDYSGNKDGLFGIEIETETPSSSNYPPGFLSESSSGWKTPLKQWRAISDGSLREFGVEFVLKGPQTMEETRKSLEEFHTHLGGVRFIQNSPSTSVHVHINMLSMTMTQIVNFVMLYSFFENVLIEFSGPTRRSNLFALPIKNCDKSLTAFIRSVIAFNAGACDAFPTSESEWKYSALNFCPLLKHGSFEIRSFRGTTDIELIWTWVNIIKCLYDAALGGNPRTWLDNIRDYRSDLIDIVFKDKAEQLKFPDYREMLNKNLIYPVLIASSVPNWDTFEDNIDRFIDGLSGRRKKPKISSRPWEEVPMMMEPGYRVEFSSAQAALLPQWVDQVLSELIGGVTTNV